MSGADAEAPGWDAKFGRPGFYFGTAPNAFLTRNVDRIPAGGEVLAVSDGEGRNGVFLAERGFRVTSFDVSEVGVEKARALAAERGVVVDVHVAGVEEWGWEPGRFDAVAAVFVQFAPPDLRARMFGGMMRTLRPGGLLLLHGYTPRQIEYGTGGPPFVENMYTSKLLRAAFAEHEIVVLDEYEDVLHEGPGHHGRSALVDCVVRRVG